MERMEAQLSTVAATNAVIPLLATEPAFVELKSLQNTSAESILISCGKAKIELHEDVSKTFLIKFLEHLAMLNDTTSFKKFTLRPDTLFLFCGFLTFVKIINGTGKLTL